MNEQTEILREILSLLKLIAEPAIAKRDEKLRSALYDIVGKSAARAKAVQLMDGTKNQAIIGKQSGMDQGGLSRFMKSLREVGLLGDGEKAPKISIPIPPNFPDRPEADA